MLTCARPPTPTAHLPAHWRPCLLARTDTQACSRLVQEQSLHVQHGSNLVHGGLRKIELGRAFRVEIERVVQSRGADLRPLDFDVRGCLQGRPGTRDTQRYEHVLRQLR